MAKKVLLVATVQSHIVQFHRPLAEMLHENGCEVHVAARNNLAEKNGLKLDFADRVYEVCLMRSPKSKYNLRAYKQLKQIINENDYDIIHCNTPMGGIVTRLAAWKARKRGTKVFYTAHGFHFYKGASKKNWLVFYPIEKFFARYTDKLITIVDEDYNLASQKFKTQVCRIHSVGANAERYRRVTEVEISDLRQKMNCEDKFVVLCTGELNPNKNQKTVVRAMQEIVKTDKEVMLLLAGNGAEDENLQNQINELGLAEYAKLIGYRTDLERYVNMCDVAVSASIREGLGMNLIEAMICGKPVVAAENRGHRELVKHDVNGYLVPPFDYVAFAEKILKLKHDSALYARIAAQNIESVKPYCTENVKKELYSIYFE